MKPDAKARVRKYLLERAKMRSLDFERIHGLNTGGKERKADLTSADLKALCDRVEALEAALREICDAHDSAKNLTLSVFLHNALRAGRAALEGK